MLERLWMFLTVPPTFEDDERHYGAQLLHWILIAFTLTEFMMSMVLAQLGRFTPLLVVAVALNVLALYLLHRRAIRLASLLFISIMWVVVTLSGVMNRGVVSASVALYIPLIILAAILLTERAAVVIALISVASLIIMTYVEASGLVAFPLQTVPHPVPVLVSHLILFSTVLTIIYFTARRIRSVLQQLKSNQRQLAQQNRELAVEITERHRAEAERDRLFELSVDMMGVANMQGYFLRVNPAFERVLGYTAEEMLSSPLFDFVHPEDVEPTRKEIENLGFGQHQPVFENRYRRKDGEYRWLSWATTPADGFLYAVARDVTDQKQAVIRERELLLAQEKTQFMGEFLSTISHDLKTPLAVIDTGLYLLERISDPEKQRVKIRQIKEQTAMVEKFIQDVLMISRLDNLPVLEKQPLDLNQLLSGVEHQLRARAETKGVDLQLDLGVSLPMIAADVDQFGRAFTNLVENAVNYTPKGGQVVVRTFADDEAMVVEVADTGIGIQPEDLPHLYERFFRSNQARALERTGSGLGLAIVKKIMDMHGCVLGVTSQPEQGTTFSVRIPQT